MISPLRDYTTSAAVAISNARGLNAREGGSGSRRRVVGRSVRTCTEQLAWRRDAQTSTLE